MVILGNFRQFEAIFKPFSVILTHLQEIYKKPLCKYSDGAVTEIRLYLHEFRVLKNASGKRGNPWKKVLEQRFTKTWVRFQRKVPNNTGETCFTPHVTEWLEFQVQNSERGGVRRNQGLARRSCCWSEVDGCWFAVVLFQGGQLFGEKCVFEGHDPAWFRDVFVEVRYGGFARVWA